MSAYLGKYLGYHGCHDRFLSLQKWNETLVIFYLQTTDYSHPMSLEEGGRTTQMNFEMQDPNFGFLCILEIFSALHDVI